METPHEPFPSSVRQGVVRAVVKGLEGPAMMLAGPPQFLRGALFEFVDGLP